MRFSACLLRLEPLRLVALDRRIRHCEVHWRDYFNIVRCMKQAQVLPIAIPLRNGSSAWVTNQYPRIWLRWQLNSAIFSRPATKLIVTSLKKTKKSDARKSVDDAIQAFDSWVNVKMTPEAKVFLLALLFYNRGKNKA